MNVPLANSSSEEKTSKPRGGSSNINIPVLFLKNTAHNVDTRNNDPAHPTVCHLFQTRAWTTEGNVFPDRQRMRERNQTAGTATSCLLPSSFNYYEIQYLVTSAEAVRCFTSKVMRSEIGPDMGLSWRNSRFSSNPVFGHIIPPRAAAE